MDISLRPGHGALAAICYPNLPILINLQEHTCTACLKLYGGQTTQRALRCPFLSFLRRATVRLDLLHRLHTRRKLHELELRVTGYINCLLLVVLHLSECKRSNAGRANRCCLSKHLCLSAIVNGQMAGAHADSEDVLLLNNNGVLAIDPKFKGILAKWTENNKLTCAGENLIQVKRISGSRSPPALYKSEGFRRERQRDLALLTSHTCSSF